jgi:hypothetical protein
LDEHAQDGRHAALGCQGGEKLKGLAVLGQLEKVECKTTSCVATHAPLIIADVTAHELCVDLA